MSKAAQELLDSAMKLSEAEREELIAGLMDSLEIEEDEATFHQELRRRVAEVESGQVKTISRAAGRAMIMDDQDVFSS